ncbi:hypothetical protein TVAG_091010 [Trichomonas vaginalis G3]|uniref:Uncharacterized protein n=1 Tax=Trichomonas vaginalis (strain ATCC PRA-98 / G3) TaxID=412133 RepID=A2F605_TRIV3|nr:hypothetical protein TVAG_091010 [Trichomonas vaginalis G3]|eukprot:XP_001312564.1 hypothetical protein [Trichomonas vaginalis G3]
MDAINEFIENVNIFSSLKTGVIPDFEKYFLNFIKVHNVLDFCREIYTRTDSQMVHLMFSIIFKLFLQNHWDELSADVQESLFNSLTEFVKQKVNSYLQLNCCLSDIVLLNPNIAQNYFDSIDDKELRYDFLTNIVFDSSKNLLKRFRNQETIDEILAQLLQVIFDNFDNYEGKQRYDLINNSIRLAVNVSIYIPFETELYSLSTNPETIDYLVPIIDSICSISNTRVDETNESFFKTILHSAFQVANIYLQQENIDDALAMITMAVEFDAIYIFSPDFSEELEFIVRTLNTLVENELFGNEMFRELIKLFIFSCAVPIESDKKFNFYILILDIVVLFANNGVQFGDCEFDFVEGYLQSRIVTYFEQRLTSNLQPGHFMLVTKFKMIPQRIINPMVQYLIENPFYDLNSILFIASYGIKYKSHIREFINILTSVPIELIYDSAQKICEIMERVRASRSYINSNMISWLATGFKQHKRYSFNLCCKNINSYSILVSSISR